MTEGKCLRCDFLFFFEALKTTEHQPRKRLLFPFILVSIHTRTVIPKALGDSFSVGANHSASKINPAWHPPWPCNFSKQSHHIKKLTPATPPLSYWHLLVLATQINYLFPFPEIRIKFHCDKGVSILDWPHQFPRREPAQIWQSPQIQLSTPLSSLHLLKKVGSVCVMDR